MRFLIEYGRAAARGGCSAGWEGPGYGGCCTACLPPDVSLPPEVNKLGGAHAAGQGEEHLLPAAPHLCPSRLLTALPVWRLPCAPQAEREAEERRLQESIAELEAARKQQAAEVEQSGLPSLLARIVAFFLQIQRWVQQLWASLTGGSGSGSAAGASA